MGVVVEEYRRSSSSRSACSRRNGSCCDRICKRYSRQRSLLEMLHKKHFTMKMPLNTIFLYQGQQLYNKCFDGLICVKQHQELQKDMCQRIIL